MPGAFVPFADPGKNAVEADIFWRAEDYRRVLFAYVRSNENPGFGSIISLRELACRKTILRTVDGAQHLLVRDGSRVAQLQCDGEKIDSGPFALEIVIGDFRQAERQLRLVKRFADICRNRRPARRQAEWTVEAMRHRDALVALDLRMEGRSYRQIAIFLYGEKAVRRDWTNPDQTMKNRVIRSVKRGRRMMNGGYRTLLA